MFEGRPPTARVVRVRHELVRSAIVEGIAPARRQALHAAMLALLREEGLGPAGDELPNSTPSSRLLAQAIRHLVGLTPWRARRFGEGRSAVRDEDAAAST